MSEKDKLLTFPEALNAIKEGLQEYEKIAKYEKALVELRKAEAALPKKLKKEMGQGMASVNATGSMGGGLALSEDKAIKDAGLRKDTYIDEAHSADQKKRLKQIGPGVKTGSPEDEAPVKENGNDEGSGGPVKPNGLKGLRKRAMEMSKAQWHDKPEAKAKMKRVSDAKNGIGDLSVNPGKPTGSYTGSPKDSPLKGGRIVSAPVAKADIDPAMLANHMRTQADKGAAQRALKPKASTKAIAQHIDRMHNKLIGKSPILGNKTKPEKAIKVSTSKSPKAAPAAPSQHVPFDPSPSSAGLLGKGAIGMDPGGRPPKAPQMPKMPGVSNKGGTPALGMGKSEKLSKPTTTTGGGPIGPGAMGADMVMGEKKMGKGELPSMQNFQSLVPKKPMPSKDKSPKLPGMTKKLPDMGSFQSLVPKKPAASPDKSPVAQTNKQLGSFQSIAGNTVPKK